MESSLTPTSAKRRTTEPSGFTTVNTSVLTTSLSAQFFQSFADDEYRSAYADEYLNTFIPLQIKTIREQRGWTQTELGKRLGNKAQAWICKLEDPNYARFSLATLRGLARAFDCILEVRFRSFKDYSDDQDRRRPGDTKVNTYAEDAKLQAETGSETLRMTSVDSGTTRLREIKLQMAKAAIDRTATTGTADILRFETREARANG